MPMALNRCMRRLHNCKVVSELVHELEKLRTSPLFSIEMNVLAVAVKYDHVPVGMPLLVLGCHDEEPLVQLPPGQVVVNYEDPLKSFPVKDLAQGTLNWLACNFSNVLGHFSQPSVFCPTSPARAMVMSLTFVPVGPVTIRP